MKIFTKFTFIIMPIAITFIKIILFVPVHITGGEAGVNEIGYMNVFDYVFDSIGTGFCYDCFEYQIMLHRYIVENLLIFVIACIFSFIIYKILKKHLLNKGEKKNV